MNILLLLLQLYLCFSLLEFEPQFQKAAVKQQTASIASPLISQPYNIVNTHIYPKIEEKTTAIPAQIEIVKEQSKASQYTEKIANTSVQILNVTAKVSPIKDYWAVTNIYPEADIPDIQKPIQINPQKEISSVEDEFKSDTQAQQSKRSSKSNSNLPYVLIAISFVVLVLLARYCSRKKKANKWGSIKRMLDQRPNASIDIIETPAHKEKEMFEMGQREKSNDE